MRVNWEYGAFPIDLDLIETGSFFSNLRVGLPYEFDFMIDLTPLLPAHFTVCVADAPKVRYFIPHDNSSDGNIPTLKENIYYYLRTNSTGQLFFECTEFGVMLLHVGNFCNFLYTAFGNTVQCLGEKWKVYDFSTTKASPAFSFSMFY